jgi:hypothetical protein
LGVSVAIFALSIVFGSFFPVEKEWVFIVQWLEKFARLAGPGFMEGAIGKWPDPHWGQKAGENTPPPSRRANTLPVVHFALTTRYRHVPSVDS